MSAALALILTLQLLACVMPDKLCNVEVDTSSVKSLMQIASGWAQRCFAASRSNA